MIIYCSEVWVTSQGVKQRLKHLRLLLRWRLSIRSVTGKKWWKNWIFRLTMTELLQQCGQLLSSSRFLHGFVIILCPKWWISLSLSSLILISWQIFICLSSKKLQKMYMLDSSKSLPCLECSQEWSWKSVILLFGRSTELVNTFLFFTKNFQTRLELQLPHISTASLI